MVVIALYLRNLNQTGTGDWLLALLSLLVCVAILWRFIRLRLKRRKARLWPKAIGKIINKQVSSVPIKHGIRGYQADFYYSFTVSASSFYGDFHSIPAQEDVANANVKMIEIGQSIVVRYDPSNSQDSAVLSEDNPNIPLKLELEVG